MSEDEIRAATTVGAIRKRSSVQSPQLNERIGRDGRDIIGNRAHARARPGENCL